MSSISAIAFTDQSANGILSWFTEAFATRARMFGISVSLIDLLDKDFAGKLNKLLGEGRPSFCFSFQGFGMGLKVESGNLWEKLNIPFFSVMGDAPFHSPQLHANKGRSFYHLYVCEDFQKVYRDAMRGHNFSMVTNYFYPSNPFADDISWRERDLELVYVKTGVDPTKIRAEWSEFPKVLREVIEDAASVALTVQEKSIGQIVADSFAARNIFFGERMVLYLRSCSTVDFYVRAVRAERMLHQVMRHGGHIFGAWPHVDSTNTRAKFYGSISATELDHLYARSRILVNIAPSTLNYVHERILAAFMGKSFMISDGSAFVNKKLQSYQSFLSIPNNSSDLPDAFDARISEIRGMSVSSAYDLVQILENSRRLAENQFGIDRFVHEIVDLAFLHTIEEKSTFWKYSS
jgi:hypothetical protein